MEGHPQKVEIKADSKKGPETLKGGNFVPRVLSSTYKKRRCTRKIGAGERRTYRLVYTGRAVATFWSDTEGGRYGRGGAGLSFSKTKSRLSFAKPVPRGECENREGGGVRNLWEGAPSLAWNKRDRCQGEGGKKRENFDMQKEHREIASSDVERHAEHSKGPS